MRRARDAQGGRHDRAAGARRAAPGVNVPHVFPLLPSRRARASLAQLSSGGSPVRTNRCILVGDRNTKLRARSVYYSALRRGKPARRGGPVYHDPRATVARSGRTALQRWALAGKTVLITGASEGIGRALALELAALRCQLVLGARDEARLESCAADCRAAGAAVTWRSADLAQPADCTRLVEHALERFGGLDVLVNNAGMTMWSRFESVSDPTLYQRLLSVNYLGAVHTTAAALPHLVRSRGLIVAVASLAGLTGVPERSGYAASKHALVGFFESLRIELRERGVDVLIVAPDFVVTQIHRRAAGPDGRPLGVTPMQESHLMSARACAQLMVRAMRRRQRLLITSRRGHLARWARLLVPALVDRLAARAIRERR
ncbi:MAG: SDR family oxidoreductase [Gammaproteobacteria bacterium]|nr:SDR family oxidoreductase [Gammaproteobacteria bacterium]